MEYFTLGIETSCDDTGVAMYSSTRGIIAEALQSQRVHNSYGGVVPELASRDHITHLAVLVESVCASAQCAPDSIACTIGPGLNGALLVGMRFASAYARAANIPCIPVHHMEGHLLSPLLEHNSIAFPFVALLISGGHTMFIDARTFGDYAILGETQDDAAGEAFDKVAKLLGLGYPGGAALSSLAAQADAHDYVFPRPMCDRADCMMSFSGLKTHVRTTWLASDKTSITRMRIARAFEETVADILAIKTAQALQMTGRRTLVVAGGVSANARIRSILANIATEYGAQAYFPSRYCTDNGAMIAYAGNYLTKHYPALTTPNHFITDWLSRPRWSLAQAHQWYQSIVKQAIM